MGLEDGKNQKMIYDGQAQDPANGTLPTSIQPAKSEEEALDIFRCAPMSLLQLYIPIETAPATVAELGNLGLVQFRDVTI